MGAGLHESLALWPELSRPTVSHHKDLSECWESRTGDRCSALLGPSEGGYLAPWASTGLTRCCSGGLPGWPLAAMGCPTPFAHDCPSPGPHWPLWWLLWDSLKATADLRPHPPG